MYFEIERLFGHHNYMKNQNCYIPVIPYENNCTFSLYHGVCQHAFCVGLEKKYGVSVWDSIPAKDCDVVLVFPVHANTDTLTWLRRCLKENLPVLIIDVRYHPTARFHAFCLTECYDE